MNLKDMTREELIAYRAAVEVYGTSRELYEVEQLLREKEA